MSCSTSAQFWIVSWNEVIPKRLEEFVDGLETNVHYELRLDSDSSLAFAAGYCLNPKRGVDVGSCAANSRP